MRALRAETSGSLGERDLRRHERARERPRRLQNQGDSNDDGPVIVDESGNVVEKDELEQRQAETEDSGIAHDKPSSDQKSEQKERCDGQGRHRKQEVFEVGTKARAKRKISKVVGADAIDGEDRKIHINVSNLSNPKKQAKKKAKVGAVSFNVSDED